MLQTTAGSFRRLSLRCTSHTHRQLYHSQSRLYSSSSVVFQTKFEPQTFVPNEISKDALHPESVPLPWGYVSEETAIAFGDRIRAVEEYKKDTEPVPQAFDTDFINYMAQQSDNLICEADNDLMAEARVRLGPSEAFKEGACRAYRYLAEDIFSHPDDDLALYKGYEALLCPMMAEALQASRNQFINWRIQPKVEVLEVEAEVLHIAPMHTTLHNSLSSEYEFVGKKDTFVKKLLSWITRYSMFVHPRPWVMGHVNLVAIVELKVKEKVSYDHRYEEDRPSEKEGDGLVSHTGTDADAVDAADHARETLLQDLDDSLTRLDQIMQDHEQMEKSNSNSNSITGRQAEAAGSKTNAGAATSWQGENKDGAEANSRGDSNSPPGDMSDNVGVGSGGDAARRVGVEARESEASEKAGVEDELKEALQMDSQVQEMMAENNRRLMARCLQTYQEEESNDGTQVRKHYLTLYADDVGKASDVYTRDLMDHTWKIKNLNNFIRHRVSNPTVFQDALEDDTDDDEDADADADADATDIETLLKTKKKAEAEAKKKTETQTTAGGEGGQGGEEGAREMESGVKDTKGQELEQDNGSVDNGSVERAEGDEREFEELVDREIDEARQAMKKEQIQGIREEIKRLQRESLSRYEDHMEQKEKDEKEAVEHREENTTNTGKGGENEKGKER